MTRTLKNICDKNAKKEVTFSKMASFVRLLIINRKDGIEKIIDDIKMIKKQFTNNMKRKYNKKKKERYI